MGTVAAVPKRAFGNTGVSISRLCLGGGSFLAGGGPALLDEALRHGVDCWEVVSFTGNAYGKYFQEHPDVRPRVFLSAKVYSTEPRLMQEHLDSALRENETSSIDFLAVHGIDRPEMLTDDVRHWAEKAKAKGKVRFFGFCTHRNMEACLSGAADLDWVDGVQTAYNYRLRQHGGMQDALRKCHDNGVGIFAVKSMGLCVQPEAELCDMAELTSLLARHHVSLEQAKLKAIWQTPYLTSVCSLMPTAAILRSNAEAAADENPLHAEIDAMLHTHASRTGGYFCSRCGRCNAASPESVPIFDILEMLMYARAYGMKGFVAKRFAQIPQAVRDKIDTSDYSLAERACPQRMPIARLMKEAAAEFSG